MEGGGEGGSGLGGGGEGGGKGGGGEGGCGDGGGGTAATASVLEQLLPLGVTVTTTDCSALLHILLISLKVGLRLGAEHVTCPSAVGLLPAVKVQVLPEAHGKVPSAAREVSRPFSLYLQEMGTLLQATQHQMQDVRHKKWWLESTGLPY